MSARPNARIAVAAMLAVFAASCASGGTDDDGSIDDIVSRSESSSPPTAAPTSDATASETTVSETVPVDAGDEVPDTAATTTVPLTPSPEADLPTAATPTEPVPATTLPGPLPTPDVRLIELAAFVQPVEATGAEGDPRLFVVLRDGSIVALDDESNEVVLDIADVGATSFTSEAGEQGLLGLAFHPNLDTAYVNFTDGDGNTVVAEFAHDPTTFVFDPDSFREVLSFDQPANNHNGGELEFGPDGFLYIGTGDGGADGDRNAAALDTASRLGKILRIDPVATPDAPFQVPDDNPFVGVDGADPTIWARGLRNPWTFSFDSLTGDLWIADVGQASWEEVNLARAIDGRDAGKGLSFGWSAFEGPERNNEDLPADGHAMPVTAYDHEDGRCAISGGVVARDSTYGDLNGWYIYGDFCSGEVWALDTTSVPNTPDGSGGEPTIVPIATVPGLSAVIEGPYGDIYALSANAFVYRLAPA